MRKVVILAIAVVSLFNGCRDEQVTNKPGQLAFVIAPVVMRPGRIVSAELTSVVVSLEDANGKSVFDSKAFNLKADGANYTTDAIDVGNGQFRITKFWAMSGDDVSFAVPRSGSDKAVVTRAPLPITVDVTANKVSSITPELVAVLADDSATVFGYSTFGPGPHTPTDYIQVRVKFEPMVGNVLYSNVDAEFVVKGYDANNIVQWEHPFNYIGPEPNDLAVKTGYHHYTIAVSKWGLQLLQQYNGDELSNGAVREGEVPLTRVFAGTVQPKRIISAVSSTELSNGGVSIESKTTYEYDNSGAISRIQRYAYSKSTEQFGLTGYSDFTYANGRVSRITNYDAGTAQRTSEDTYTYDATGQVTSIVDKSFQSGIDTEVQFTYPSGGRVVHASYRLTNGTGFEYEFVNEWNNLKSDVTSRSTQVCSTGAYSYDKNINPLRHLNYVDYLLRNFSAGNRLTENVVYSGCAYPSLIPDSYTYVYDGDGYPVEGRTSYKGHLAKTLTQFYYQ